MSTSFNTLSRLTLTLAGSALALGLLAGAVSYASRASTVEKFIPGSNAIPAHIIVVLTAIVLTIVVIQRHSRAPKGTLILLAPFSKSALERFRKTVFLKDGA